VIAEAGRSSNTIQGRGNMSHDWYGGEARFVYEPKQHVVRNETGTQHRELIVETLHPTTYDPMGGNLDIDLFPGGLGSVKPSWTVSFTRGALTASKTQLAPGDAIPVSSPYHVILALSDLELAKQVSGKHDEALDISAEEARILAGGSEFKLVNTASVRQCLSWLSSESLATGGFEAKNLTSEIQTPAESASSPFRCRNSATHHL
jgi:hypothetical protein